MEPPAHASPPSPGAPRAAVGNASSSWAWCIAWALVGAAVATWLALVPLEGVAHVQDEVVYRLQARLLAEGSLWEPERLPRAAHHYSFVINAQGRRYGVFPNGWPAVLAVGVALGVPWLINPLLHAVTVVVGARLAGRVAGDPVAERLAAPLLAFAPGLVLQAASGMAHTLCALLTVVAVALVVDPPSPRRALALGSALGWLALTRPLDALVIATILAVWILARREAVGWLWALGPMVGAVALIGLQNYATTGAVTVFPQSLWFSRGEPSFPDPAVRYTATCNALGFGPDRGCEKTFDGFGHSPAKAVRHALQNLRLVGPLWLGSWLLAPILAGVGWLPDNDTKRSARSFTGIAVVTTLALAIAYSTYWYGGTCFGPRFLHAAAPLVVIALALGLAGCAARFSAFEPLLGLLVVPLFGFHVVRSVPELHGYWGVDGRLDDFAQQWDRGPALILVAYGPPFVVPVDTRITTGGIVERYSAIRRRGMWIERNDEDLRFAEFQPALVDVTRAQYPGRPTFVLVLTGDPKTDQLIPVEALPAVPQRADLELPVTPPPFGR